MNERGILFSAMMVRSNRSGLKGETRRVMNPQPPAWVTSFGFSALTAPGCISGRGIDGERGPAEKFFKCPYGAPGDRVYVKEATWIWCRRDPDGLTPGGRTKYRYVPVGCHVRYCADDARKPEQPISDDDGHCWRYKSARFMPKWATRNSYEIVSIRVERLTSISASSAINEGIDCGPDGGYLDYIGQTYNISPVESYRTLWTLLHGTASWSHDAWVWVVAYRPALLTLGDPQDYIKSSTPHQVEVPHTIPA